MGDVIQFPRKPAPPSLDGELNKERMARIQQSLNEINNLMQQLREIRRKNNDIFED